MDIKMDIVSILKNDECLNSLIVKVSRDLKEDVEWIKSQVFYDIYDIYNEDLEKDYEKVKKKYIVEIIEKKLLGWNHKDFKQNTIKQQEHDDYLLNPFEVEEGVVQCPRCQSFKVYSYSIQLRAADEPMTTMAECTQCKLAWSQNG